MSRLWPVSGWHRSAGPATPARAPRRAAGLAALLVAGLGLAGCVKPTPLVTLQAHGVVVSSTALVYCRPTCRRYGSPTAFPRLSVAPGEQIGIDVAQPLPGSGWYVTLNRQQVTLRETGYYATITAPQIPAGSRDVLEVYKLGPGNRNYGVWQFILTPS